MIDVLNRWAGVAALIVALLALVMAVAVPAVAQRGGGDDAHAAARARPRAGRRARARRRATAARPVLLGRNGKIPARLLPTAPRARVADRLGEEGATAASLTASCAPDTVDLGTWCLSSAPYPLADDEIGKNDYLFATQKCVELGGWLPSAAQLVGAAARVKLNSTIDDERLTASIDVDPADGLKDRREMSATLVTTAAGSSASGALGVSDGSKGDPKQGEPDPVPLPSNPTPETLQHVTVFDKPRQGRVRRQQAGQPAGGVPLRVREGGRRGRAGGRLTARAALSPAGGRNGARHRRARGRVRGACATVTDRPRGPVASTSCSETHAAPHASR